MGAGQRAGWRCAVSRAGGPFRTAPPQASSVSGLQGTSHLDEFHGLVRWGKRAQRPQGRCPSPLLEPPPGPGATHTSSAAPGRSLSTRPARSRRRSETCNSGGGGEHPPSSPPCRLGAQQTGLCPSHHVEPAANPLRAPTAPRRTRQSRGVAGCTRSPAPAPPAHLGQGDASQHGATGSPGRMCRGRADAHQPGRDRAERPPQRPWAGA